MRRTILLLLSVAVSVVLLSGVSSTPSRQAQAISPKPNFVFILADDMRRDDLAYMPKTLLRLGDEGMTFSNAYVSNPLCCPARATIMRGQYAHNTGVWDNINDTDGGWQGYQSNNGNNEKDNIATSLDNAGYMTALIGKYLNDYNNTTYKPPGWDKWFATFTFDYFNYDVNNNQRGLETVDTAESSAAHAHPSIDDHDETVEAHYSGLKRPHACNDGWGNDRRDCC